MCDWLTRSNLNVLVGYGGSGKTECAVNLVLALQERGCAAALADLDVVNPYFRSRERRELFKSREIRFVATSQACVDADIPAIPAQLNALLEDQSLHSVLDIGGGPGGARVLAQSRHRILNRPHRVCFVLNAARPATGDLPGALASLREIERANGLRVTHIIHNTHLCDQTRVEDVLEGMELARELSRQTQLPILCHAVHHALCADLPDCSENIFPLHLYMNKPWEISEETF